MIFPKTEGCRYPAPKSHNVSGGAGKVQRQAFVLDLGEHIEGGTQQSQSASRFAYWEILVQFLVYHTNLQISEHLLGPNMKS